MTLEAAPLKQSFNVSGNLLDIHRREVRPVTIVVRDGIIADIVDELDKTFATYFAPGFVDAHVHVESSMLPPCEFGRLAAVHGTVATVSDPHEIANVLGVPGVEWMLEQTRNAPIKILFGAPSCVPATSFDRAGAEVSPSDVESLLRRKDIGYLTEMMNYPGVVYDQPDVLTKLAAAKRSGKPIDGHAPGLSGQQLKKYVAAGITSDHECVTLTEAREKRDLGMRIQIREGSAAKNFAALEPLLHESPQTCLLCSDDKHPNDLVESHIDALVRRALVGGAELFDVWRAASLQAVEHYRLDVGLLRVGDAADFIEVDSLTEPHVRRTWTNGRLVAEHGKSLIAHRQVPPINHFSVDPKQSADFRITAEGKTARVLVALDGQLITREKILPVQVENGKVACDPANDVLKITVVNRYSNMPPAVALIQGFGLKSGAIASSVSHDSHNIVAVGVDDDSLCRAVNEVIAARGGLSVVTPHEAAVLSLPLAGLMSDQDGYQVAANYARIDALAKQLGSPLSAPFMTLSFMALLVIPALKLGPEGLFDGAAFKPVSLWA